MSLRDDWERTLFALVPDEEAQDALNDQYAALEGEVERLREYARSIEIVNIDLTARLQDYVGQYDPTDAYVAECQAEVERLQEKVKAAQSAHGEALWPATAEHERGDKFKEENTELRKLVLYMFRHTAHSAWHDEQPDLSDFADRMRELGIEVD